MCGIAGWLSNDSSFSGISLRQLGLEMAESLRHRGPDDEGVWTEDPGVVLAHRRLAIIDQSSLGRQPMADTTGRYVLVYNGEHYNFRELRQELEREKSVKFTSETDTEVVLNSLILWGWGALSKFNGMFALALWDRATRSLFLARDHLGIKPLYYAGFPLAFANGVDSKNADVTAYSAFNGPAETIAFASETKALRLAPGYYGEVSRFGLQNILAFGHAVGSRTIEENVRKLPPGHLLQWQDGAATISRWDRGPHHRFGETDCFAKDRSGKAESDIYRRRGSSFEAASSELRSLLRSAVERQLVADVPVGLFLSGGVDSSVLCALACQIKGQKETHAFSLGFSGVSERFDETAEAAEIADRLGCVHHILRCDEHDLLNAIDDLVWHYDEPFADPAALAVLLLARMTKKHVSVCLSGEGADELFGGYRRYATERYLTGKASGRFLLRVLGSATARLPGLRRLRTLVKVAGIEDPALRYAGYLEVMDASMRQDLTQSQWWTDKYEPAVAFKNADPLSDNAQHPDLVERLCLIDQRTWMIDTYLEKTDKASMASGLEVRVPFLDRKIVAFANQLPDAWRMKLLQRKYILRQAFKGMVPDIALDKPKRGFAVPVGEWLRGPLSNVLEESLLSPGSRVHEFIRPDVARRMIKEHRERKPERTAALWTMFVLARWCDKERKRFGAERKFVR